MIHPVCRTIAPRADHLFLTTANHSMQTAVDRCGRCQLYRLLGCCSCSHVPVFPVAVIRCLYITASVNVTCQKGYIVVQLQGRDGGGCRGQQSISITWWHKDVITRLSLIQSPKKKNLICQSSSAPYLLLALYWHTFSHKITKLKLCI